MRFDRLDEFLKPLYQDLDGVSRGGDVARIGAIVRALDPAPGDEVELLLRLHFLGSWLQKVGNASRTALNSGIDQARLLRAAASARRLAAPQSAAEKTVAAALLIDAAGVRGLAERFARARREGRSIEEVARETLLDETLPDWMGERGRSMLAERRQLRDAFCRALLSES